ncbi:MAG TPA: DNA mismatch repair endonuclease MutL, partial [Blastocatellia bacterium]
EVEFNGGKLVGVRDIAWPGGAEIEVKDLFFNVPVRRKFFKSDATEGVHIATLVQHYALAHPEIAFMLIKDGREVIRTTPAGSLRERAYQVLGGALLDKLNEVEFEAEGIRVSGFASNPQEQRSSRDSQYFFVNKRYVRDQLIGRALSEAYRAMMPSGAYAAAVLFIDLPPSDVDVNVHPAKTQVRFLHEGAVLGAVRTGITKALESSRPVAQLPGMARASNANSVPYPSSFSSVTPAPPAYSAPAQGPSAAFGERTAFDDRGTAAASAEPAGDEFRLVPPDEPVDIEQALELVFSRDQDLSGPASIQPGTVTAPFRGWGQSQYESGQYQSEQNRQDQVGQCGPGGFNSSVAPVQPLPGLGHGIKPLGQIRDSYVVATDEEGLMLIDQHVAHERILFEQFRDVRLARPVEAQPTLVPQSIDLTPAEAEAFSIIQEPLESMGIEVSQLSGRTIAITAGPAGLATADAIAVVRDVLAAAQRERRSFTLDHIRDEIAASMACKAAIKVNMPLTAEKMQWLIDELMKTANPMTCPHGRPIMMRFGLRDIERGFKRPV